MNDPLMYGLVFNQSNLQSFNNCEYQFLLRYVYQLEWPAPVTADLEKYESDRLAGSDFHRLVHQYFLGIDEKLLRKIALNNRDRRISSWFETFICTFDQTLTGTLQPECTYQASIEKAGIAAKYDLLQISKESYTIFDWKTSSRVPHHSELIKKMQTRVYPYVLYHYLISTSDIKHPVIQMVYWEVNDPGNPFVINYSHEKWIEDNKYLNDLMKRIKSMATEEYQKTTDLRQCQFCLYRSHCRIGLLPGQSTLDQRDSAIFFEEDEDRDLVLH